jgi:hypothetical protein
LTFYFDITIVLVGNAHELSLKSVIWIGSIRKDLWEFPEPVLHHTHVAQRGGKILQHLPAALHNPAGNDSRPHCLGQTASFQF